MKRRVMFLLSIVAVGAFSAYAQRTVTNTDLERFRQARLRAEADLRENYARLGFASPEVMAARNEESSRTMFELAEQLRSVRLERERIAADVEIARHMTGGERYQPQGFSRRSPYDVDLNLDRVGYPLDGFGYGGGFSSDGDSYEGRGRGRGRGQGRSYRQQGYFAGGQFWPTGSRTRVRPIFAQRRTPRRR